MSKTIAGESFWAIAQCHNPITAPKLGYPLMMGKLKDGPQGTFYMLDLNVAELSVRKAAAHDASSSADLLTQLSRDPNGEIRRAVAGNPNTPTDVLVHLGKAFPDEVIANPIFKIWILEDPNHLFVWMTLTRAQMQRPDASDAEVLYAIAQNPATPGSILENLVLHPPRDDGEALDYEQLWMQVAKNPNTPVLALTELASGHSHASLLIKCVIAENPNTPAEILAQFATYRNGAVHQSILRNPQTPALVLEILAAETHPAIQATVKAHPNASQTAIAISDFVNGRPVASIDILEQLASDHRHEVRHLVAEHPSTPSAALRQLSHDPERTIRLLVACHAKLPPDTLEQLAQRLVTEYLEWLKFSSAHDGSWGETFLEILKHPHITARTLEHLTHLTDAKKSKAYEVDRTIEGITKHPKASAQALETLAKYYQSMPFVLEAHKGMSEHPNMPAAGLEILIQSLLSLNHPNSLEAVFYHLLHPNVPQQRLEALATHPCVPICAAVAKNPSTPLQVLQRLATHTEPDIRRAVTENLNAPSELLQKSSVDPNPSIRKGVAKNPNTSRTILKQLANDTQTIVRFNLAKNPSIPIHILKRFVSDPVIDVRGGVLINPKTPPLLLEYLTDETAPQMRVMVAQHPNTSVESILKLSRDQAAIVRLTLLRDRTDLSEVILEAIARATVMHIQSKSDQACFDEREHEVLNQLAQHPQTSRWILHQLASNQPPDIYQRFGENWFHFLRISVASNLKTPISILEMLINDPDLSKNGAKKAATATLRLKSFDSE
ncbi:MAG: hypothetical protein WCD18_06045 [Thermosynechococcaceae cyanobacterium]